MDGLACAEDVEHRDKVVASQSLLARELDDLAQLAHDNPALGLAHDPCGATPTHLQETLVAQRAQRAQHRVRVHAQLGGDVAGLGEPLAGMGFALGDRPANLRGDLEVQEGRVAPVEGLKAERLLRPGLVDRAHDANYSSVMTITHEIDATPAVVPGAGHQPQLLLPEAKRRGRRRRAAWSISLVALALVVGSLVSLGRSGGATSPRGVRDSAALSASSTGVLTCAGTSQVRPVTLVIACADANAMLTATHWTTWNARGASGVTRFGLNLCQPYCAASPMSYFAHSEVRLYAPVSTSHGRLFSGLVVRYRLRGATHVYRMSWRGSTALG